MTTTAGAACCCWSAGAAGCCSTWPVRTSSATARSSGSWACAGRVATEHENKRPAAPARGRTGHQGRSSVVVLGSGGRPRGHPAPGPRASIEDRPAASPARRRRVTTRGGRGTSHEEVSPVQGRHTADAFIDNGGFGTHRIRCETGRRARLANGSAVVYLDDETMVLSATTASKQPKEGLDFFPLTVDVEERMYAAGRIPGSFFRREGRPSEDAILTCRLIDRPLRPSFVKGL